MKSPRLAAVLRLVTALSIVVGLSAGITLTLSTPVAAQSSKPMSKKEKKKLEKEWKAKAKAFAKQPLSLRDNQEYFKKKVDELNKLIAERDAKLFEQEQKLSEYDALKASLAVMQNENTELRKAYEASKETQTKRITPGLTFKVQIGAFKNFDLSRYLSETSGFEGESGDALNKYTLGDFRDMANAEAFKKDIRKMGIRDAWIVAYRDGIRIDMKQAKQELGATGAAPASDATTQPAKPAAKKAAAKPKAKK
jgi:hypothetical protein